MNVPVRTDPWAWWQSALAGNRGTIQADEPETGFFRARFKNKATGDITFYALAYWREAPDNTLRCRLTKVVQGRVLSDMLEDNRARESWPWASKEPISHETYTAYCESGTWPDQHAAATADRRSVESARNSEDAPDAESFDGIRDRIEDLAREADTLIKAGAAKTKAESDRAADLSDRLLKLEKLADDKRAAEKRPHMDAAADVQRKWTVLVTRANAGKADLKKVVVTPFLKKLEQVAASATEAAVVPPGFTPVKRTAGTTTSVGLRTVTTAVVEDWAKAVDYFAGNTKVRELIQQLANAAAKQGTCPAGCRIHTEKTAS